MTSCPGCSPWRTPRNLVARAVVVVLVAWCAASALADGAADWMGQLPDERSLAALTIPGTHDSGARFGAPYGNCQSWTIDEQLERGIRFLDVRCRRVGSREQPRLAIVHGVIDQRLASDEVVAACQRFLAAHPREAIVMRIKEEGQPERDGLPGVGELVGRYVRAESARWRLDPGVPALRDARGRIVVISQVGRIGDRDVLRWGDAAVFDVQDAWDVPTLFHVESKWERVRAHLDAARTGASDRWFIDFASGAGFAAFPERVAARLNPRLHDWVAARGREGARWGTVVMDFPTVALVDALVASNRSGK